MAKTREVNKIKEKNIANVESRKVTRFNIVFINIQLFLTFFTIGLFIWYIIDADMVYTFQLFLGITLLVMAYNNQIIYQRKKATVLYTLVGVALLILDLIMYIGVHFIGA